MNYYDEKIRLKCFQLSSKECFTRLAKYIANTRITQLYENGQVQIYALKDDGDDTYRSEKINNIRKIIRMYAKRCDINEITLYDEERLLYYFTTNFGRYLPLSTITNYGFVPTVVLLRQIVSDPIPVSLDYLQELCETIIVSSDHKLSLYDILIYIRRNHERPHNALIETIINTKMVNIDPIKTAAYVIGHIGYFGWDILMLIVNNSPWTSDVYEHRAFLTSLLNYISFNAPFQVTTVYDLCKYLIECGKNLSDPSDGGNEAIRYAPCKYGGIRIFKLLIEHGADVNKISPERFINLFNQNDDFYPMKEVYKLIRLLVNAGLDLGRFSLYSVITCCPQYVSCTNTYGLKIIKYLLKNGISREPNKFYDSHHFSNNVCELLICMGFTRICESTLETQKWKCKPVPSLHTLCLRKVYTTKSIDTKGFPRLLLEFPEEDTTEYLIPASQKWVLQYST